MLVTFLLPDNCNAMEKVWVTWEARASCSVVMYLGFTQRSHSSNFVGAWCLPSWKPLYKTWMRHSQGQHQVPCSGMRWRLDAASWVLVLWNWRLTFVWMPGGCQDGRHEGTSLVKMNWGYYGWKNLVHQQPSDGCLYFLRDTIKQGAQHWFLHLAGGHKETTITPWGMVVTKALAIRPK